MENEVIKIDTEKALIPTQTEIIKSRDFGRIKGHLTRNQRVGFTSLLKNAYLICLEQNNQAKRDFEVPLSTILQDMNINHDNVFEGKSSTTVSLETQLTQLMTKMYEMRYKNEKGKTIEVEKSVLISDFKINKETNIVRYSLSRFVQERLICYGNAYISEMPTIASFKSGYAVALHEQLEQRKDFQKWKVSVSEFRDLMGVLESEYSRIFDFKKNVLNPAINEIEKNTNYFNLKVKDIKSGKKIVWFEFTWGFEKKEKEHKNQSNFSGLDEEIEELKNCVFYIEHLNLNFKLLDIRLSDKYSEYCIYCESSDGKKGEIKGKQTLEESIQFLKELKV